MNKFLKNEWLFIVLLIIPFIIAVAVYPNMPGKVPNHWNFQGEVDGYSSRTFGTFFLPFLNLFMYAMFLVTPYLDPKKRNYEKFAGTYRLLRYIIQIFMILIYILTILAALGHSIDIGLWVSIGVALLFIIIGNVMGRVRHNYFVGFKMPWTLANEEVWRKTHQVGSKLMVAGGIFALVGVIFTEDTLRFAVLMAGVLLPSLITTIYSFIYFKKISK